MMLAVVPNAPPRRTAAPELGRDVLERCKAGDAMAFRAFVVRYERPVFALLSRILGHGAHVEDLAQETFLRAFRAFPGFDLDAAAKPSTWIVTIATRLALDARKRGKLDTVPIEAAVEAATGSTPETEHHRRSLRTAIAQAAAALPEEQRVVFVLAELHGLAMAEIATIVEVPEATIRTRLFRARTKMQDRLDALREEAR